MRQASVATCRSNGSLNKGRRKNCGKKKKKEAGLQKKAVISGGGNHGQSWTGARRMI